MNTLNYFFKKIGVLLCIMMANMSIKGTQAIKKLGQNILETELDIWLHGARGTEKKEGYTSSLSQTHNIILNLLKNDRESIPAGTTIKVNNKSYNVGGSLNGIQLKYITLLRLLARNKVAYTLLTGVPLCTHPSKNKNITRFSSSSNKQITAEKCKPTTGNNKIQLAIVNTSSISYQPKQVNIQDTNDTVGLAILKRNNAQLIAEQNELTPSKVNVAIDINKKEGNNIVDDMSSFSGNEIVVVNQERSKSPIPEEATLSLLNNSEEIDQSYMIDDINSISLSEGQEKAQSGKPKIPIHAYIIGMVGGIIIDRLLINISQNPKMLTQKNRLKKAQALIKNTFKSSLIAIINKRRSVAN